VAGDGDVATFRSRVAELGLEERISLPGWLDPEAVEALLCRSHVLVLPSHAEGLPMSVIEAFSAGIPAVSSTVGGLEEVVRHEENGLVVTPGDVTGLVDALCRLHDDEPLRRKLADGALMTWREGHSIDRYAHRLAVIWWAASGRPPLDVSESSPLLPWGG